MKRKKEGVTERGDERLHVVMMAVPFTFNKKSWVVVHGLTKGQGRDMMEGSQWNWRSKDEQVSTRQICSVRECGMRGECGCSGFVVHGWKETNERMNEIFFFVWCTAVWQQLGIEQKGNRIFTCKDEERACIRTMWKKRRLNLSPCKCCQLQRDYFLPSTASSLGPWLLSWRVMITRTDKLYNIEQICVHNVDQSTATTGHFILLAHRQQKDIAVVLSLHS